LKGPPTAPVMRQATTVPLTGEVAWAPGSVRVGLAIVATPPPPMKSVENAPVSGLPTVTVAAGALAAGKSDAASAVAITARPAFRMPFILPSGSLWQERNSSE